MTYLKLIQSNTMEGRNRAFRIKLLSQAIVRIQTFNKWITQWASLKKFLWEILVSHIHLVAHIFTHLKIALKSWPEVRILSLESVTSCHDFSAIFPCVKVCNKLCNTHWPIFILILFIFAPTLFSLNILCELEGSIDYRRL